jgi:hypothetical protein
VSVFSCQWMIPVRGKLALPTANCQLPTANCQLLHQRRAGFRQRTTLSLCQADVRRNRLSF